MDTTNNNLSKNKKTNLSLPEQLVNALLVTKDLSVLNNNRTLSIFISTMIYSFKSGTEISLLRNCINYIKETDLDKGKLLEKEFAAELEKLRKKNSSKKEADVSIPQITDEDFLRSLGIKKTVIKKL